ncbi:vacuolar protein sorting-associated protein 32 2 isoform X2 [Cinnamomum micranthum f. kanehirae]|uniref:Vacuolar protein sorting-associated protein 32 2 isoform X2 n=1 Tax=Cinnamomum micranthum f. kanehirae TaxID=337451 RepID=A0A3S3QKS5_9MAGN|nr:vacuolar protein sorting-associated protein 32 2 isoform X2 [Cinnamomum micranthum f. kanehirae]
MFSRFFRKCSEDSKPTSSTVLNQTSEMLEEKENVLQKKISIEVERAKEFTRANNRQAALQCLKRKKFYEVKMEQLGSFQLRIHDQEEKLLEKLPVHCGQAQRINRNIKSNHAKSNQLERGMGSN